MHAISMTLNGKEKKPVKVVDGERLPETAAYQSCRFLIHDGHEQDIKVYDILKINGVDGYFVVQGTSKHTSPELPVPRFEVTVNPFEGIVV